MTQFEFYKSFQFVTELIVAEFLYVCRLRRGKLFWLRLLFALALLYAFAYFFPTFSDDPFYISFVFLVIFLFNVLLSKFVFKERWLTVVFCCIAGYTTQHLAYEFHNMLLTVLGVHSATGLYSSAPFTGIFDNLFLAVIYFSVYSFAYFLCYLLFAGKLRKNEDVRLETKFIFAFSILIFVVDILLNAFVVYNPVRDNKTNSVIICTYNMLCCFISLYLQFSALTKKKMENTLSAVERMWHTAKEQYEISKENIEIINMKCHDFRHQVRMLRGKSVDEAVIRDLESRISIYDSVAKTENAALDVILTEKSLYCNNNGIRFSIIADGKQLDFMAEEDIYALFGNIIDNAIESALKCPSDRRTINLQIKRIGDIVMVRESNCYADEIEFENGLPVTTKKDKWLHGYGMRSIEHICGRYGGDLSFTAERSMFTVSLMFFRPVRAPSEKQDG